MADSADATAIARSFAREALGETVGDAAGPSSAVGEVKAGVAPPTTSEPAPSEPPPSEAASSASTLADRAAGAETLAEAILAAITGNPDILSAQARRDDARYAMRQSRAALLPNVDLTMSEGLEGTRSDGSPIEQANRTEAQIALRQLIWDFGAVGNDVKRARAVYEGVDWALRNEVERVAFDVAAAYIGVLERQQLAALAEENVAAHERILQTVQNQRQFGLVSGADVSRVEAKLNAARGALLDRRSDLAVAKEGFRRQLNRLPGDLAPAPLAGPLIPEDVEATLELAEKGNPELRQAAALLESLRRQTAGQRAGMLPRIELEAQGNWKNNVGGPVGRSDDARAMVTMRYKLYDGGAQSAAVSRAKARLRQAEFDFDRTRRDIVQLVRSDYAALAAARDKVAAIEQEVQAGERLVDLYVTQFRAGGRSVFDLLDSQETLIAGKSKRISNVAAREIAAYRVLKNIGELFIVATGDRFEAVSSR
jgi:adhesin transport system outer membrane protein